MYYLFLCSHFMSKQDEQYPYPWGTRPLPSSTSASTSVVERKRGAPLVLENELPRKNGPVLSTAIAQIEWVGFSMWNPGVYFFEAVPRCFQCISWHNSSSFDSGPGKSIYARRTINFQVGVFPQSGLEMEKWNLWLCQSPGKMVKYDHFTLWERTFHCRDAWSGPHRKISRHLCRNIVIKILSFDILCFYFLCFRWCPLPWKQSYFQNPFNTSQLRQTWV